MHLYIHPFLTYGIIIWGNTYKTTLQPIFILQKRAMRLIAFSRFDEHSSPLFKSLEIIKFLDLATFHLAIFMYKYHNQLLSSAFKSFFTKISQIHTYNTRLGAKQSYYLPKARTNYGIFNIRFQVHQYGIPLTKISNYLHCLCLKRKWNSTLSKITRHLYIVWVTLKWK